MVKLQKHSSLPCLKLLMELFSKKTALQVKLSCAKWAHHLITLKAFLTDKEWYTIMVVVRCTRRYRSITYLEV
jgi:hypothetical protein